MAKAKKPPSEGFSRFTECSVCLGRLKNHRCLSCFHAFCHDCLVPIVEDQGIRCPVCRNQCILGPGGVSELSKNPVLVEVLEKVCEKCEERNKEIQCGHCGKWMCPTCHELCILHAEIQDTINTRSKTIKDLQKTKRQKIAHKDKCITQLTRNLQEILSRTLRHFEREAEKQTAQLDDMVDNLETEIREMETLIHTSDRERIKSTVSSVRQLGDDWKKSIRRTAPNNPAPPGLEPFLPDVNLMIHEILDTARRLAAPTGGKTRPINYRPSHITHETLSTDFKWPGYVALSPLTGNVIVTDLDNNSVVVFDQQRKYQAQFGSSGRSPGQFNFGGVGGVDVTSYGHIIVCDTGNNRIQMLSEQGEVIRVVGSKGGAPGQFDSPSGVTVHESQIYVVDANNQRIQVLGENGMFIREFSTHETATTGNLKDLIVCPNGDVVVSVSGGRGGDLMVYANNGHYKKSLCTGQPGSVKLQHPLGVTIDAQGNLLVTDYGKDHVHVVTQTGRLIHTFGSYGDKAGQLEDPVGVACTRDGSIIIADKHRVQYFRFG